MKHRPRKRFGQNFLTDSHVISDIIYAIAPTQDQHLVEIGPGQAAITKPLLKTGCQLDIIELDRDLAAWLTTQFNDQPQLNIHCQDALQFDFSSLTQPDQLLRIVGNLPYNISTPLLFHLLDHASNIHDMHIMLQKEVAERMSAKPGSKTYGKLSVILQYHCQIENLFEIEAESFNPPPKVSSAFLRLTPHTTPPVALNNEANFRKTVAQAFSQRRKTIRNTLKPLLSETQIQSLNINPDARAETLDLVAFARLSNLLQTCDTE